MLGRTHMAIGALGMIAAYPVIQHVQWEPISHILHSSSGMPHSIVTEATIVFASVVGSIIPDLDQPNSMMAHKVERIGQIAIIAALLASVFLLHLQASMTAWIFVLIFGWLSSTRGNSSRLAGLGVLGAGIIILGLYHNIPIFSATLLAIWAVGAMFTYHRTFTHSLLGLAIFGVGVWTALKGFSHLHLELASDGLILGYALHMAADAIAGGVPLFWPWKKRQGIRLVRTGGAVDHMIGGIVALAFLGLAVF